MLTYASEASPACSFNSRVIDVQPDIDTLILVGDMHSRPLKLAGLSCTLALAIKRGASESELIAILGLAYPNHPAAHHQRALQTFIGKLRTAGLLDEDQVRSMGRWSMPNPDPLAEVLAGRLLTLPARLRRWLLRGAVIGSVVIILLALQHQPHWREWALSTPVHWAALGVGVLAWLILHELAHAVACRMHGCPVSGAGLMLRGFLLPSPFINTSAIHLFPGDAIRLHVAIAGPVLDLLLAGVLAAELMLMPPGSATAVVQALLQLVLLGLYFNLTPFRISDGRTAFDVYFGDIRQTYQPRWGRASMSVMNVRRNAFAAYAALYIIVTAFVIIHVAGWAIQ